jgi:RNA polymerase sigma factor (sigma-70 family)
MHPPSLKTAVRRIRSLAGPPDGISDSDLLARYRASRDERAFAALVGRHGPAVLGTCRRILADPHAAEDAFQATFLVLARRAGAIRRAAALGFWLHGVAVRVSMKLKGRLARQPRCVPVVEIPADPRDDVLWRDVRRVLDEEVNRLPERLRLPVYLCYFEGKTRDEAADALGWKVSTLRGRLEDGRSRLRTRLALRGIELSAALLAVSAATDGLAVGDVLMESTVRAAGGSASEVVRSLVRGVAASGVAAKTKLTAGMIVLALGLGTALLGFRGDPGQAAGPGPGLKPPPADEKPKPPAELIALMQAADRIWVVDSPTDKNPVPEPAEVLKGMSPPAPGYSFAFKADALRDLPRTEHRWVVFFKSIDEVDHIPKVAPLAVDKWFVPADDATLAALREYFPPCEWGESSNGLRLGLYARPKADEPTVEVVLQNIGTKNLTVEQFRGNYFDDWPHLTFTVTGPDGKAYRLERQGGAHKDSDAPTDRVLKAGDRYIHVVRLNRWLTAPERGARGGSAGNAPAGLFAGGGEFKVQATYMLTDGRDPPRWWIGKLTAGPVTVSIPAPGAYGDAAGDFRVRLRPIGKLKVGESPELVVDAKYTGKEKWTIDRRPENAEVEWDGKWYSPPVRRSFGGRALTEMAPGSEFLPWETVRPNGTWSHEREKPGAAGDPGEATKELVPFRLTPGSHTVRVAYWFGKDVRAVSNAITVEVAPDGWGDSSGGVRARLRLGKTKLKPGDPLAFELDLKNEGRWTTTPDANPFACEVFVDNERYTYTGPIDRKANVKELKPGGELVPFVSVTVDALWQARRMPEGRLIEDERERPPPNFVPFRLMPGKHKIRVTFWVDDKKVHPESNTVEIDVETPQLDAATRAMALRADRIWVVPSPTREKPVPSPIAVLKGPPADATRGGVFDLRLLPGDDPTAKWIVFLLADEDKQVAEVKVWQWAQWSRPYTPELAEGLRKAFLPTEWSPERDGLRLGLRLRQTELKSGEPVAVEVTIRNVGTKPRELQQLRYNIYDYWPQLRFEVTVPGGKRWLLQKPDGPISEADAPTRITLQPGATYTHSLRLDRWADPLAMDHKEHPDPRAGFFAAPGDYTITARYMSSPLGHDTQTDTLVSPAVKLAIKDPAEEPAWGDAVGGVAARLRLAKGTFKAGEPFAFELDIKNTAEQTYDVGPVPQQCRIELDGLLTYTYIGPIDLGTPVRRLSPGITFSPFVGVTTDRNWAHAGWLYVPFKLTPGKHTVRVSYPLSDKVIPVSQPVEFTVTADEWGEASGGIRARVRLAKATFKAGEPLAFELDLKNTGDQTVEDGPIPMFCLINLDGHEYRYTAPLGYPTSIQKLTPGKEFVPWVKVETNQWWTHVRGEQAVPLVLTPGKHTLKVTYPLPGDRKPTCPAVEFEVTDDAKPDLATLAAAADRIVVADLTRRSGVMHVAPKRAMKGPAQHWASDVHPIVVPAGCDVMPGEVPDDPVPGSVQDVGSWILFLKAHEDGEGAPKLTPAVPHGWYHRATDKEIEAVAAALPKPTEAGEAVNGVTLSLRPRTQTVRAGEEVRLEVVLTNTTKDMLRVLQQRYNAYDYWPFLTFQITLPNGMKLTVVKPEGEYTREDFVDEATLKAGESYAHAVRLDRWPAIPGKQTEDLGLPAFAFAVPGTYKVQATYKAPIGFKNLRPDVAIRDWPFWNGELTSNTMTVEVKSPFEEVRLASEKGRDPILYVVLTRPNADPAALAGIVVEHAAPAVAEFGRRKLTVGNVVFLVRDRAADTHGFTTGFSREQLEAIHLAKPADARRLAGEHAWTLGRLPDGK